MTSKSKFQLLRQLEVRINNIINHSQDFNLDVSHLDKVFILGFNYGNVTSYVGLTTDFKSHDSGLIVVGILYPNTSPSEHEVKATLDDVRRHYESSPGYFSKFDKNDSLYLIYYSNEESNQASRKLFNYLDASFVSDPPVLVTLEERKIYMHSVLVKLRADFRLEICDDANRLLMQDKIDHVIDEATNLLTSNVALHLSDSNFSTKTPFEDNNTLESLYTALDVPAEVESMGDYLPQMTKEEKKKLRSKWRNKMKDQRAPLQFEFECEGLSTNDNSSETPGFYNLNIEEYFYLQVNDPISKCTKQILYLLRQKFKLLKNAISSQRRSDDSIEMNEVKSCTFKPRELGHLIHAIYLIPSNHIPLYDCLKEGRKILHETYLIPISEPALRYSQRINDVNLKNQDQLNGYLCNVHEDIAEKSGVKGSTLREFTRGTYTYHHYMQDNISDNGWGCAYRSLQTIISWFKHQGYIYSPDVEPCKAANKDKTSELRKKLCQEERVPTHEEIQQVLVDIGDKQPNFVGSQKWIGSQEVCFVLDHLYNIESKFISVSSGSELVYKARELGQHFSSQCTPVMIGGGVLAHTIIGVDFNEKNGDISYLVLDPHYTGAEDLSTINKKGWCGWKKNAFWDKSAFYNLCMPRRPADY